MTNIEIRPLSLGEILDRSFSLYRNNFRLFAGISVIPHLIVLVWSLAQLPLISLPSIHARAIGVPPPMGSAYTLAVDFVSFVAEGFLVYLFAQAPTAYAVSELYLGRTISVRAAFGRLRSRVWRLASGTLLTGATILVSTLLLLVPGVSLACRLLTALPAATLENLGPRRAFGRSFNLTRDYVSRALMIYLLYFVLRVIAYTFLYYPQRLAVILVRRDAGMGSVWLALVQVGAVSEATLILPFLMIAATVFYFDLRVRKEALDLRLMLNADGELPPASP
jgi:hypothetical protein